ncbi:hypothetical protein LTR91_005816 [Friedmanniomyces endolithicus]|uniref:Uncharacterized protein n=1 Tax=Friedmanniomyces endolithicus TaxID=329885 RepID=A0AAN6QXL1_9PEZI|nr:hypothetical protein LTR57_017014 [Friedmanniomyces endolithicus]KAK0979700.1 hypothetical protein LTS01_012338 [Friedmanniomyces endolithicus]KAK0999878.1 hypothetical protein LTR91_005816 [Friedmanniomyces endolithicus]KAK1036806.1 hypothetical protein LTS16_013384 [Friedmanniomyces endolithicus]
MADYLLTSKLAGDSCSTINSLYTTGGTSVPRLSFTSGSTDCTFSQPATPTSVGALLAPEHSHSREHKVQEALVPHAAPTQDKSMFASIAENPSRLAKASEIIARAPAMCCSGALGLIIIGVHIANVCLGPDGTPTTINALARGLTLLLSSNCIRVDAAEHIANKLEWGLPSAKLGPGPIYLWLGYDSDDSLIREVFTPLAWLYRSVSTAAYQQGRVPQAFSDHSHPSREVPHLAVSNAEPGHPQRATLPSNRTPPPSHLAQLQERSQHTRAHVGTQAFPHNALSRSFAQRKQNERRYDGHNLIPGYITQTQLNSGNQAPAHPVQSTAGNGAYMPENSGAWRQANIAMERDEASSRARQLAHGRTQPARPPGYPRQETLLPTNKQETYTPGAPVLGDKKRPVSEIADSNQRHGYGAPQVFVRPEARPTGELRDLLDGNDTYRSPESGNVQNTHGDLGRAVRYQGLESASYHPTPPLPPVQASIVVPARPKTPIQKLKALFGHSTAETVIPSAQATTVADDGGNTGLGPVIGDRRQPSSPPATTQGTREPPEPPLPPTNFSGLATDRLVEMGKDCRQRRADIKLWDPYMLSPEHQAVVDMGISICDELTSRKNRHRYYQVYRTALTPGLHGLSVEEEEGSGTG